VSKINCKEDFLRCIGLQRRNSQYKYKIINSGRKMKRINIPNGVILRDCSIVILGVACELCGKCFKCETDLNIHISLKHWTYEKIHSTNIERTRCTKNEIEVCEKFLKSFNNTTIEPAKSFATREHKMVPLTLKIGEEVIAKKLMKRKHLKKALDKIQIESGRKTELIAGKNMHGSTVSCIDPVVFNSPYQCCNPSVHAVQCSNRYLASNIVASEQVVREKIIAREKIDASNRLKESCAILGNKKCDVTVHGASTTSLELNMSFITENCNIHELGVSKENNLKEVISTSLSDTLIFNELCKAQFTAASNTILNCDSITSSKGTCTQWTNIKPENVTENTKQEDISTNQKDFTLNKMEKYTSKKMTDDLDDDSKTIHLILPFIVPIVVPNASVPSSPVKVTIQATTTEQRKQEQQDMKKMEDLGLHLLEKVIDCTKKKKRSKSNSKSSDTNDDCAKEKKKRIITESNSDCKNQTKEKHTSGMKEHAKAQGFNSITTIGVVVPDNVKENLMTHNENIDIAEMTRRYGINYYNDVSKINDNAQSVQEPVSRFLVPSSGEMENRSNGTI
ncbi:unnamed protein product, partial [Heterotrigona itama]